LGPKSGDSRPITDRVKESLFSVLYKYGLPDGATVGDLFCGVGSLGLEALSRGGRFVTFVEQDHKIIERLERNIEKSGFVRNSKVIRADAFRLGVPAHKVGSQCDLVFVDPPYAATAQVGTGSRLGGLMEVLGGQVRTGGVVVVRTRCSVCLFEEYGCFEVVERRKWGKMAVVILQKAG